MRNLFLLLFISTTLHAQQPQSGQWQGVIEYPDEDVPFTFRIQYKSGNPSVTIINGDEELQLSQITIAGDSILIPLTPFDAVLKAKFDEHSMEGEWKKGYKEKGIPFQATYGTPRFKRRSHQFKKLSSRWDVEFVVPNGLPTAGVGLIDVQDDKVTATFLTHVGDYRYFEGVMDKDSIIMSSFDGVHAFLVKLSVNNDSITGQIIMDPNYSEEIKGQANPEAQLTSPYRVIMENQRPFYDMLANGDPENPLDLTNYLDKVVVVQLFGTWCPNSYDQTQMLKDWYMAKPEEVELLAVTFEPNFSVDYGNQRISAYKEAMQIPYEVKLGGKLSKWQAGMAFPIYDQIKAFPTLILLDRYGFIRYAFDYYNGPATGDLNNEFKEQFLAAIETLVKEKGDPH